MKSTIPPLFRRQLSHHFYIVVTYAPIPRAYLLKTPTVRTLLYLPSISPPVPHTSHLISSRPTNPSSSPSPSPSPRTHTQPRPSSPLHDPTRPDQKSETHQSLTVDYVLYSSFFPPDGLITSFPSLPFPSSLLQTSSIQQNLLLCATRKPNDSTHTGYDHIPKTPKPNPKSNSNSNRQQ